MTEFEDFHVVACMRDDDMVISVRGEIDAATRDAFREVALSATDATDRVTFDLAGVTFMDSSGLGVIAETLHRLRVRGGGVSIRSAPDQALQVLQIAGFDKLCTMITTEDANGLDVA